MQEITIASVSDPVKRLGEINQGRRAIYRGQRRDRTLLPKISRLTTPLPLLDVERAVFNEFQLRSVPLLEQPPENDWEWLAVMQHHGLATRLLDWSVNPLTALWFAVSKPAADGQYGVLWLFQPQPDDYAVISELGSPFSVTQIHLVKPRIVTARLGAQLGWFTIHPFDPKRQQFVSVEDTPNYKARLTKLIIPPERFPVIRFELDRLGVNASTLFPDLEGLCANLEWLYSTLPDENTDLIGSKIFVQPSRDAF